MGMVVRFWLGYMNCIERGATKRRTWLQHDIDLSARDGAKKKIGLKHS